MTLKNIDYYKTDHYIIYPKSLSGHPIIDDYKRSHAPYALSKEESSLKVNTDTQMLYIQEIEKYNVEVIAKDHFLHNDDFMNKGEFFSRTSGTIQLINHVGVTHFRDLTLYVLNKKITEQQYEAMVQDIQELVLDLVYDFNNSTFFRTRLHMNKSTANDYHVFRLLLVLLETAEPDRNIYHLLNIVLNNLHQQFDHSDERTPFTEISTFNEEEAMSLASSPTHELAPVNRPSIRKNNALVRAFAAKSGIAAVPLYLTKKVAHLSYDNHENRFIKYFIQHLIDILNKYNKIYSQKTHQLKETTISGRIKDHLKKLHAILASNVFKEIGELHFMPFQSQVLNKKEGYRQLFNFYNILHSRHVTVFDEATLSQIDAKNIDYLYELWCFLKIIDILTALYGPGKNKIQLKTKDFKKDILASSHFEFQGNEKLPPLKLYFKKSFSFPESYSQTFQPDIVVEMFDHNRTLNRRLIFDAKFKIEAARDRQFKTEDLNKMHTYVDAIAKAYGSFVLYPGEVTKLYHKSVENKPLHGVGAIPFKPLCHNDVRHLQNCLEKFLNRHREEN